MIQVLQINDHTLARKLGCIPIEHDMGGYPLPLVPMRPTFLVWTPKGGYMFWEFVPDQEPKESEHVTT